MSIVKPTAFVLEHAPWSFSKAEIAKQCPYRFKLQYVDKLRMKLPPNEDALIGTALHTALEHSISGMKIFKAVRMSIEQHQLTTAEIARVESLVPAIKNFMTKFNTYCVRHKAYGPVVEKKLAVDLEGNPTGFWNNQTAFFRGAIDVYAIIKRKPIAVMLDHKTGKDRELSHFEQQFNGYLLMLRALETHLEKIQIGINFLKTDRIEFVKGLQDVRDIQPMLEKLIKFLNDSTENAQDFTVVNSGPLCGWCDYQSICPAHSDTQHAKKEIR